MVSGNWVRSDVIRFQASTSSGPEVEGMAENDLSQKSSGRQKCQWSNTLAVVVVLSVVVTVTILYVGMLIVLVDNGSSGLHTNSPNATVSNDTRTANDLEISIIMVNSCGGTLNIPNDARGIIAYKNGTDYENDEHCVWIIKAAMRKVQVKFIEQDFNRRDADGIRYDGFVVGELDDNLEEFTCQKLIIQDYSRTRIFVTPFVLYFTSDGATRRHGFVIQIDPVSWSGAVEQQPVTSFVQNRKRGALALTSRSGFSPSLGAVAVFQPRATDHCFRRNYTCQATGKFPCCDLLAAYEMNPYHNGGACLRLKILNNGSVVSEKTTVMMYWNDGVDDEDFSCRITWLDTARDKSGLWPCYPDPNTAGLF